MTKKEQNISAEQEAKNLAKKEKNDSLKACEQELADLKEKYVRSVADFDNYKRRSEQERARWALSAQSAVFVDLLAIVDNFDRAQAEHEKKERTPKMDVWLQGFELIGKSLYKLLDKYNVKPVKDNKTFNPELHEALVQVDSQDHESGQIVDVLQKGFTFKGELLRPAKVSVAK
ncbi:nucleotide exchange factor GrpE [Candidatus Dependentiae bacterium]|nr:nucleotide exchange factor GrpE [Candidatus Dependentiae bacterium]